MAHSEPGKAEQILANPFYQAVSSSFAGTQEYMAMEKLGQLKASAGTEDAPWDLIVVDTPPSRSALDFLDAPNRLGSFLDGRFIRLLTAPAKAGGRAGLKVFGVGVQLVTGDDDEDPRRPDAHGRPDVRQRPRHDVRRLPRARRRDLPAALRGGHGLPRRRRTRAGRAARGVLLRRPPRSGRYAAGRARRQPHRARLGDRDQPVAGTRRRRVPRGRRRPEVGLERRRPAPAARSARPDGRASARAGRPFLTVTPRHTRGAGAGVADATSTTSTACARSGTRLAGS